MRFLASCQIRKGGVALDSDMQEYLHLSQLEVLITFRRSRPKFIKVDQSTVGIPLTLKQQTRPRSVVWCPRYTPLNLSRRKSDNPNLGNLPSPIVGVARRISAFKSFRAGNFSSDVSEILRTDSIWSTFGGSWVDVFSISPLLLPLYSREGHENPQKSDKSRYNGAYGGPLNFYNSRTVQWIRTKFSWFVGIDRIYNPTKFDKIRFISFREIHHIPHTFHNFDPLYLENEPADPRIFFQKSIVFNKDNVSAKSGEKLVCRFSNILGGMFSRTFPRRGRCRHSPNGMP